MKDQGGKTEQWLKDMPVTAETPGFKPEEMVICEKCARKNPPTRLKCFYCGEQLSSAEAKAELVTPNLRQMEAWEKGFNVIINSDAETSSEETIHAAAKLLRLEPAEIKSILEKGQPLPAARADSQREADLIGQRLAESGLSSFIWPDEDIALETPPRRLRGLEITDDSITFLPFNKGEAVTVNWEYVALIVAGGIFEKKISSSAKRSKNEEKQITETSETSRDEAVLDIYTANDPTGWRILMTGFDFSCLGAQKGMLAVENIKRLIALIRERSPNARFDDSYIKIRSVLGKVWGNEEKMASHKWQREGMGKFHFDNVTVIDNVAQFTKYSRLQQRLLENNK